MRTRFIVMVGALLLVSAGAQAQNASSTSQQDVPQSTVAPSLADIPMDNQIDFGVRGTSYGANSDEARHQRYRDLRDGGTLDLFRFSKTTDSYLFNAQADHVGYRDQRFSAGYNNFGKVKATFEWNQIPLYYSATTQTPYAISGGTLTMSDAIQSGIQNKTLTPAQAVVGLPAFDMQMKRNTADFKLTYSANQFTDVNVTLKNTQRTGNQPFSGTFGFGDSVELPLPVDTRTTDMGANLEFSNETAFAKIGYEGSFFRNNLGTIVWDNPQRISDIATAPVQGRMSMWPNTDSNTISAAVGYKLPASSHASAFVSVGTLSNNDTLIPFTINSAIAPIALDRPTAEAKARVTAMNYEFTSRPASIVWLSARYRQYQFDNKTPEFFVGQLVNYDSSVATLNAASEAVGYTRHTVDGDVSLTPSKWVALRGGFTREMIDYTARIAESTTEDTARGSVDLTGISWLTLRGVYEHAKRTANGLMLDEWIADGEQQGLRQYDISDRSRDRFSGIVQIMPVSQFSINASAGVGKDDFPGAYFGLQKTDNKLYSVGFDFVPQDKVSMGVNYGYETNSARQASRTAINLPSNTPQYYFDPAQQFNDPRRDWYDDAADKAHSFTASIDLLKAIPKTEIRYAYEYDKATSTYTYSTPANSILPAIAQLAPVMNKTQRSTLDFKYFLTRHLAAGFVYWYDQYDVNDFALGPQAVNSIGQPALLLTGYYYAPYKANTVWGRLTYLW